MKKNLKRLIRYYKPYMGTFLLDMFFAFLASGVALVIPLAVRYITSGIAAMSSEEALQAVIPELFGNAGAEYIHCGHFEENIPSRELLRKLGFREYASHQVRDRLIVDEILRRKA